MSRHYFDCDHKGEKVRVVLGYDRPLDEYFLLIERLTGASQSTAALMYASIADPENCAEDLGYYADKLKALGIEVPDSLFEAVDEDAIEGRGNLVVEHFVDGTTRIIYDERAAQPVTRRPS